MSDNKSIITPFCKFLEEDHSQNPSPLIGLIKQLKKIYHKTKADLSLNFSSYSHHVDDEYLDYFINEVHSCYQIHDTAIKDIQEWLDEHSIKINDIDKLKYPKELKVFFELPFDQGNFSSDLDETLIIRSNLIKYFKDKYAQEMIDFLESKKRTYQIETSTVDNITSEEYVNVIIKKTEELSEIQKKIAQEYSFFNFSNEDALLNIQMKYDYEQNQIEKLIKELLNKLYIQSAKDNYYFFDCPLNPYLANIDKKIKDYLELHVDANMIDFYKTEINYLLNPEDNRLLYSHNKKDVVNYNYFCNDFSNFKISHNKKIEHLINELIGLGVETTIEENYIGRDGDQLIKKPVYKKINRPYTREKVDIVIQPAQELNENKNKSKTPSAKKSDYNTKIFRSKKAEDWFRNTLFNMNAISEDNKMIRGLSAVSDAIYKNEKCKEHIFKNRPLLKNFISHLNNNFDANIKSDKKLSDGFKYKDDIQEFINQFLRDNSE